MNKGTFNDIAKTQHENVTRSSINFDGSVVQIENMQDLSSKPLVPRSKLSHHKIFRKTIEKVTTNNPLEIHTVSNMKDIQDISTNQQVFDIPGQFKDNM